MKTVGVIGGLGPETTAKFYMEVVFASSKVSGQRPNMLISNVAVPLLVEEEIIKNSKNEEKILPFLIKSAKQLEKGGADFIVIPCNTVHVFIDEIRTAVKIPVLSIIEETGNFLSEKGAKEIGLLATSSTINNGLFEKIMIKKGIKIKTPNKVQQAKLNTIIHNLVNGISTINDENSFAQIVQDLGVNNLLLACTDLQLISKDLKSASVFDTLDILALATVGNL